MVRSLVREQDPVCGVAKKKKKKPQKFAPQTLSEKNIEGSVLLQGQQQFEQKGVWKI